MAEAAEDWRSGSRGMSEFAASFRALPSSFRRKEVRNIKARLQEGKKTLMRTYANEFGNVKLA